MSPDHALPHLNRPALEALDIHTTQVVQAIEDLLVACAEGRAWSAPKSHIQLPDGRFVMSTMAIADDPPFMAVKSLALNPRNPARGHPLINAVVTLLDSDTGIPLATLDGNWITAVRTAGLSAVAARHLARPDAHIAAFVGCGVQAHSHLRAFMDLFPLTEVRALGRGQANRDALCDTARAMGLTALACDTPRDALSGADLVVTSITQSVDTEPFLDARWLAPGAFAAITDLARPWLAEGLRAFDLLVIDDLAQEATMPTPMVDMARISGDISGLVTAAIPARTDPRQRTAFVFRGMAVGDLALAGLAYLRARPPGS